MNRDPHAYRYKWSNGSKNFHGGVPAKGRIRASIEKVSGRVPEKGRISVSIEKQSGQVPKTGGINVSTKKWYNSSEYWEKVESVRISKNCLDAYQKMVEAVCVPKNGRIRASTGKR